MTIYRWCAEIRRGRSLFQYCITYMQVDQKTVVTPEKAAAVQKVIQDDRRITHEQIWLSARVGVRVHTECISLSFISNDLAVNPILVPASYSDRAAVADFDPGYTHDYNPSPTLDSNPDPILDSNTGPTLDSNLVPTLDSNPGPTLDSNPGPVLDFDPVRFQLRYRN
ncbi:hypothetical protein EVAR_25138_1 [Eumeta japonica]|uniref:Uncharacterized protein n=1 Tax=Eumeta variegata TaxID=151549 RepID=A0A4C1XP02_EUMVA|nr:hypothetical protein EVAR_25138_1 [Eumeta japonica]